MPRITVDIDNKTHEALKLIPYGMRRLVYRAVLEKLLLKSARAQRTP